jgi:hypothetical protein
VKTEAVITGMKEEFSDADFVAGLATNQKNMMSQINTLSAQTAAMLEMFKERDNRVSYP